MVHTLDLIAPMTFKDLALGMRSTRNARLAIIQLDVIKSPPNTIGTCPHERHSAVRSVRYAYVEPPVIPNVQGLATYDSASDM